MLDISSVLAIFSIMDTQKTNNRLGSYLKALRRERGCTLRYVEKMAGVSNAYLSQLENGKIRNPSPAILHKLSKAYDISFSLLMKQAGYPFQKSTLSYPTEQNHFSQIGPVTDEEAKELGEYLRFIRLRRNEQS